MGLFLCICIGAGCFSYCLHHIYHCFYKRDSNSSSLEYLGLFFLSRKSEGFVSKTLAPLHLALMINLFFSSFWSGFLLGWLRIPDQPDPSTCPCADADRTLFPQDLCRLLYGVLPRDHPVYANLLCWLPGKRTKWSSRKDHDLVVRAGELQLTDFLWALPLICLWI